MSVPRPTPLGLEPSFGFGDRIGLATAGHVAAVRQAGCGVVPIFAQQSIREMQRTGRTPTGVMSDAMDALEKCDWNSAHGADADHLKRPEDVDSTAECGFTFFTIDPSDDVDQTADGYAASVVQEKCAELGDEAPWVNSYIGERVTLPDDSKLEFDELSVKRAAVKYGRAIKAALALAEHIKRIHEAAGRDYEIELSVDETGHPTTLVEHYIIAEQCLSHGVNLVSLAPRLVGDFEKGVDYLGDVSQLEASLQQHAAIARHLGPYKLSLHSGSDKLAMYPAFARATRGRFHVKTAGTSYLEALRVAAIEEPNLFREICEFSRNHYERDRATYHVHATLDQTPPPSDVVDDLRLQDLYLERWETVSTARGFIEPGRQILHCTFGSVLSDKHLGASLRACLERHLDTYTAVLANHFTRHLEALSQTD